MQSAQILHHMLIFSSPSLTENPPKFRLLRLPKPTPSTPESADNGKNSIRMAGLLPAVARGALAREQRKSMKRPVPTRPIYQALTHLDRCNALIYQDILLDHTDRSRRPLLTVNI